MPLCPTQSRVSGAHDLCLPDMAGTLLTELQPTLEMAIASRIIPGLGGRCDERPERVIIELPRDKPGA